MSDEKKEISKVPSPIEPLSGGGSTFIVTKWRVVAEKPNWREWAHIPQVQVWQACALSLDIEPNSIKRNPNSWMTGPGIDQLFKDESFQSENEKKEFESRQRMLLKNLGSKENSLCFSIHPEHANLSEVRLPEFAAWCPSVEWSIPKELAALAEESDAYTLTNSEKTKIKINLPKCEPKKVIMAALDGLYYPTQTKWSIALADPPKWLESCRVEMGSKKFSALWNPVDIAIVLRKKGILLSKLDKIFENWPEWYDEWKEKSANLR